MTLRKNKLVNKKEKSQIILNFVLVLVQIRNLQVWLKLN